MNRTMTDDGGWFDYDRVDIINGREYWDGNNQIDVHARSWGRHQYLLRTAGGRWVLEQTSDWEKEQTTYRFLDDEAAKVWLVANESDDELARYFPDAEDERGPGRPEIGAPVQVRLGELLAPVDAYAQNHCLSRAEALRVLVQRGLDSLGTALPAGVVGHHRYAAALAAGMPVDDGQAADKTL